MLKTARGGGEGKESRRRGRQHLRSRAEGDYESWSSFPVMGRLRNLSAYSNSVAANGRPDKFDTYISASALGRLRSDSDRDTHTRNRDSSHHDLKISSTVGSPIATTALGYQLIVQCLLYLVFKPRRLTNSLRWDLNPLHSFQAIIATSDTTLAP